MAECGDPTEKKLDTAVPFVGMYIAAASAVCTLAVAIDAFNGFRRKRLWFPSKYFSLNATSLTLLAVAMKLPIDFNTNMYKSTTDWSAKYVGVLFMSTALANFMSSLGSMTDKEILANVIALGILVITIAANVLIQLILLRDELSMFSFIFMVPTILMLCLLVKLVSMAIMVPTTKRRLEVKYKEQHKIALRKEEVLNRREAFRIDDQRGYMMKYWVMAETSNPQFVMAHSIICNTAICFLTALTLVATYIILGVWPPEPRSKYKFSTIWIQVIQFIGVIIGTIAPTLRWFNAVSFNCSGTSWNSFKQAFKIETHWIQILTDCRDSFSGSQIRKEKFWECLHAAKWSAVTFCIGFQIATIQLSRVFVFLSVLLTSPFFLCFTLIKRFVDRRSTKVEETGDDLCVDLGRYVLLLEGEPKLPMRVLKNMCHEANNMIQTGQKKQPRSLLSLLGKFVNFNGIGQFDSNQIPRLHSQEAPNCWALPVVTLTSIAIALPNIAKHKREQLLSCVSEGLSLAKIVEKSLYENAQLVNIRMAADICWGGVLLYMKWLEINLKGVSIKCKNSKEVLQELSKKAEAIIMEFKEEEKDPIMENPLNWPPKVVAANSMYRICQTMLLSYEEENEPTDGELYEKLSVMIADVLAACLTNLPHVITIMCHRNAIEKREKSVHKAFLLLGKTEQVVQLLQQQEWPHLDQDKAAYIDEWRALFQGQDNGDSATSTPTSSDEISSTPVSIEEHLAITVAC